MSNSRILRDQLLADREAPREAAGRGTPRFAGQVYNGGSMPNARESVYLVHPLVLDGNEAEGGAATPQVDTSRSVPVVVIGNRYVNVGDTLIVHSVGGRWVADGGITLPNCNPTCGKCVGNRYAVNGTVNDAINGTQPMIYDFGMGMWYSAWLPFTSASILTSGVGSNPCNVASGTSYYFYQLACSGNQLVANLFLPGQSCRLLNGTLTSAYFNYSNSNYPSLLGKPAQSVIGGFTLSSAGTPSSCDPMVYGATFGGSLLPVTAATFSVPKITLPSYGYSCTTPCPLPRKNLTVSWVNTGGNGSGTLVWNAATQDWTLPCTGNLTVRLNATGSNTVGFTATIWDGSNCSGTQHPFSYPAAIGMTAYTCSPLYFAYNVLFTNSLLYTAGYRSFVVTE